MVFGSVANRNYQGDAGNAASVRINQIGSVTVSDYAGSISTENVSTGSVDLAINQKKYFSFFVDDVEKSQTDLAYVDQAMQRAAFGTAKAVDAYIMSASALYGVSGSATGLKASAFIPTGSTSSYNLLVDVGVKLDEQNVPEAGRFCVVPPWFVGYLVKDSRILTQNPVVQANGLVSGVTINGMQVYKSNQVQHNSNLWSIVAGTSQAVAFAGGLNLIESLRSSTAFGDNVRGLYTFGARTIQPSGLFVSWISQS
jgi:hypothetical protein